MIRCPICGVVVPSEDCDIVNPPGEMLVAQLLCRSCGRVFTICEEKNLLIVKRFDRPRHPEN